MKVLERHSERNLVTVGRLFYENQLSKTEIAARLHISVTHVNRLLREAARRGIVEIVIRPPRFEDVEMNLRERYGLREALVAPPADDENAGRVELGAVAAQYFERHVQPGARVGLASGRSLFEMASAIAERPLEMYLFPLAVFAEQTPQVNSIDSNTLVNILWFKTRPHSKAERCSLFFPGDDYAALRTHVQAMKATAYIQRLQVQLGDLDYYFLGCSALRQGSELVGLVRESGRGPDDLKADGIIGDIAFNTLDADGQRRASGVEDVLFNVSYADLQSAAASENKKVVLVAGGRAKAPVITAALRGRLFNALITDSDTAQALLR